MMLRLKQIENLTHTIAVNTLLIDTVHNVYGHNGIFVTCLCKTLFSNVV